MIGTALPLMSTKLALTTAVTAILSLCLAQTAGQQTIAIDAQAAAHPFPHVWEQMFGSGRAILSLREDYRQDLRSVKSITGFSFVRFHDILDDDVGVYTRGADGKPHYNFSYVDQIYDGLLANGVRPFVEISFMPKQLAANPTPHAFWYKPYPSPPNDYAAWSALIAAFTRHLLDRYTAREVEQWYFEVWNEPNIDFWTGNPKEQTYYELYDATARAIKKVDPRLRVGGPATAQAVWVDRFIRHCDDAHVPFDFVSTHIYGNESPMDVFGNSTPIPRKAMVAAAIRKVHDQVARSSAPRTPIIISEYNATYLNQPEVTDSAFMGPWLANTIRECDGLTAMMSYWAFSDVFDEQGVVEKPFYGGYGIVAERGIPKPAYRAFELLHQLGSERLPSASPDALITRRADGAIVIALWNYAEPGEQTGVKTFHLTVKNTSATKYSLQILDPDHGSVLKEWSALGKPASPTQHQIARLVEASKIASPVEHPLAQAISIEPQGLALVVLR
jgi:xylan 1,4-beta-xylosidase